MHTAGIQFAGDSIEAQPIAVCNRTVAALEVGGVYALDLAQEAVETQNAADKPRAMIRNLVAVSASNINGVLVVATKPLGVGEDGMAAVLSGPVRAKVNGQVLITDRLKAVAGQNYLQACSAAAGNTDIGVGKPLETNAVGQTTVRKVLFDGVAFNKVINPANT